MTKDNATKMLMIQVIFNLFFNLIKSQMFGALFTYICPLFAFFSSLKFGIPTSNPNFHSVSIKNEVATTKIFVRKFE